MLTATLAMSAAKISTLTSGQISYTTTDTDGHDIQIIFKRCMSNELYTFQSVRLDGNELNHTDSDNIGPFLIGSGWVGGNHTNPGTDGTQVKSAKTVSVEAFVDGEAIKYNVNKNHTGDVLTIKVINTLYMPGQTEETFATETMTYVVAGNSIDVTGEHEFTCSVPQRVDRYYGMQSMFIGETETLTPGGAYATWTPINSVDRFTRLSAPEFNTFIEHSANGYQAAWMDNSEGLLGNRSLVPDNDVVFIGNSSTKSYHKIIGSHTVKSGDKTKWHGVYSWFKEPLADNCRGDKPGSFSYNGTIGGETAIFSLDADGKCTISTDSQAGVGNVAAGGAHSVPFARSGSGCISVESPDATVYSITGTALHHGVGIFYCHAGIYIVADGHRSTKLIVK